MDKLEMQHKFLVKELSFVNKESEKKSYSISPSFFKKITKLQEGQYEVAISVFINDTPENPFPFDLKATIALITTFKGELGEEERDRYLNFNCVQILFPYLRSAVTSLTSAALMNPLILPIIDVNAFKALDEKVS